MTYTSIRSEVLTKLKRDAAFLSEKFGIDTLGVFGSVARGDDTELSDINILYHFTGERGDLEEFIGLKNHLEDLFNRDIDLISIDFINPKMLDCVSCDVVLIMDVREDGRAC